MTRALRTLGPILGLTLLILGISTEMRPQVAPSLQKSPATPKAAAPPTEPQTRIVSRSELVIVPVTVKNGQGQLVADLQKGDFRVFEDNVEQQIAIFTSDPYPLSTVVLIDNDLTEKSAAEVQKSLVAATAAFGPADETALVTYDEFPSTVADFSTDNDKLFTQLKRLELGSHSQMIVSDPETAGPIINGQKPPDGTGVPIHGSARQKVYNDMDDALFAAGQMLKSRGRDRRKIVILVSDGTDARNNRHSFDESLRELLAADVSVYSISVTRTLPIGRTLIEHGASEIDKFTYDTGGDKFRGDNQGDLERLYADVTEQARNQYTLTFSPQDVKKQDYHSIEVRVTRPGLDVYARQGYYQSEVNVGR